VGCFRARFSRQQCFGFERHAFHQTKKAFPFRR
jgi:hypothetical protein